MKNLVIIASGGGTTAEQVILSTKYDQLARYYRIAGLIATRSGIGAIAKAEALGVPTVVWYKHQRETEEASAISLSSHLRAFDAEVVGLYGCLAKIPAAVVQAYAGQMLNQHPGPLDPGRPHPGGPGMYGRRVHHTWLRFLRLRDNINPHPERLFTEATAQFVAEVMDEGPVIVRRQLTILPDDDVTSLAQRLLPMEHEVQIEALRLLALGQAKPLRRDPPLFIDSYGELLLEACKSEAIMMWPKG